MAVSAMKSDAGVLQRFASGHMKSGTLEYLNIGCQRLCIESMLVPTPTGEKESFVLAFIVEIGSMRETFSLEGMESLIKFLMDVKNKAQTVEQGKEKDDA